MNYLNKANVVLVIGALSFINLSCNGTKTESKTEPVAEEISSVVSDIQANETNEVKAYYFHATRRCATCEAVEAVTKEALTEYYGDKVVFLSINRDENKDNPLLKKYKVSGQTLIFVKGDQVFNLTTDAFMNARSKPEKLKAQIKATLDPII